jgi:hypothetical protein
MRKQAELTNPESCMGRAGDQEMTFVLLGRDAAAPFAIRAWIAERIRLGKNAPDDPQIREAEECARTMEREGRACGTCGAPKFQYGIYGYRCLKCRD